MQSLRQKAATSYFFVDSGWHLLPSSSHPVVLVVVVVAVDEDAADKIGPRGQPGHQGLRRRPHADDMHRNREAHARPLQLLEAEALEDPRICLRAHPLRQTIQLETGTGVL